MKLHMILAKRAFNSKVRLTLWKKLATQNRFNMDLSHSLRKQQKRAKARRSPLIHVYDSILTGLNTGQTLGESLKDWASPEEIMLISEGQHSAQLTESLLLAASLIEAKQRIYKAVRDALAYPILLICLVLGLLIVVSTYVVPRLTVLADPTTWTGAAYVLYIISSFVYSITGLFALILSVSLFALIIYSLPYWTGRLRFKADRLPPWSIYRLTVGVVWLFTMAILMRSGKSVTQIFVDMLASERITPWLHERILAISLQYNQGTNLGKAMSYAGTGFPDPEIVEDLFDYASMPEFDKRLHEIAVEWLKEGIELIERQALYLRIGSMSLIIAMICGLVLAMGSLQQQLSTIMGGF